MTNRVEYIVTPYPADNPQEYVVSVLAGGEQALLAVFPTQRSADTFAAAMNNAMDLADGHPRFNRLTG